MKACVLLVALVLAVLWAGPAWAGDDTYVPPEDGWSWGEGTKAVTFVEPGRALASAYHEGRTALSDRYVWPEDNWGFNASTILEPFLPPGAALHFAYSGLPGPSPATPPFPDLKNNDSELIVAVRWAKDRGVVVGYDDGTFGGGRILSRCEASTMLRRMDWLQPWFWRFDRYPMNQLELDRVYSPLRWDHPIVWGTLARAEFVRLLYRGRDGVSYAPLRIIGYAGMVPKTELVWWRVYYTFNPVFLGGRAWRPAASRSDHPFGRAFDTDSGKATMRAIASYLCGYFHEFSLKYVIYDRRISFGYGWRAYHGTNPHVDHDHVSVLP